jgi:hypothetical protein
MADDKIARTGDTTVLEELCERIGLGGGVLIGVVAGSVAGAVEFGRSTSMDVAADKFKGVVNKCIEEGGKVGKKHLPGVAMGVVITSALALSRLRR